MIHTAYRQRGAGMLGFLLMFMLIGCFTLLFLKVAPIYFEHFKIVSSLESLKKDPKLYEKSKEEVLELLQKRWNINYVDDVNARDVTIRKEAGRLKIQIAYEVVQPIFLNLSALVTFDDSIEVAAP